MLKKLARQFCN